MKKLFGILFLLSAFAFSAFATVVTVQPNTVPNYQGKGTTAKIRIYANVKFTTNTSTIVYPSMPGSTVWYKEITCTVSGTSLSVPAIQIDSTTNSNVQTATYTALLYDSKLNRIDVLFTNFRIPHDLGSTISWTQLINFNAAKVISLPATYYTAAQTDVLIADLVTTDQLNSQTASLSSGQTAQVNSLITAGTTSLSSGQTTQVNSLITTAVSSKVSTTDTRLEKDVYANYSNNLITAASSIGSTDTYLNCSQPVTVSTSVSLAKNIHFRPTGQCLITVAANQTLTINSIVDPGSVKFIDSSASNAKVLFGKGIKINIGWLAGTTDGTDVTDALGEALQSTTANLGGVIHFPSARYVTTGGLVPSDTTIIEGEGNFVSNGYGGTSIKLVSPTTTYLFKIGEGEFGIRFRDILLDGTGTSSKDGILLEGSYPNSSGDLELRNVTIQNFANGLNYHSLSGAWQFAQIKIDQSIFQGNTAAGIKMNSLNSEFALESTNFSVPAGAWAIDTNGGGIMNVKNSEFAGGGSTSGVIRIQGQHVQFNFIGSQDENFGTFLQNNASDVSGITNLFGNLIQAKIQLNQTCVINSVGNNYLSKAYKDAAPAVAVITSLGDYIRPVDVADGVTPVVPAKLSQFTAGSIIHFEQNGVNYKSYERIPKTFVSPLNFDGSPTSPVLAVGHLTALAESKSLLRLGRLSSDNPPTFDFYYDFIRQNSGEDAGKLMITGNQTGYVGIVVNGDIFASGAVRGQSCVLTDGATITIDARCGNNQYVTLGGNRTFAMATFGTPTLQDKFDGMRLSIEIIQDATGSRTCAFTTGSAGQFAFGTDITSITCTTTATKRDIVTVQYSKRADRWLVIDVKKGFQ